MQGYTDLLGGNDQCDVIMYYQQITSVLTFYVTVLCPSFLFLEGAAEGDTCKKGEFEPVYQ